VNAAPLVVSAVELAVGLACLAVAGLAWPYRGRAAGTPLFVLAVAAAAWAFSAGVASLVADPGVTWAAQFATYAVSGVAAVAWFFVAVEFADSERWLRRRTTVVAVGLVGADALSLLTNAGHHLYVSPGSGVTAAGLVDPAPGPLLWLHAAWKAGAILLGIGVLLRRTVGRRGVVGVQATAILVTGALPLVAALLELLDLVVVPGLDFGVVGVAAGSAFVLWALFYADFLDLVPIARERVLASMNDAVVAVDTAGRVVDLNRRAGALLGVDAGAVGEPATTVLAAYPDLVDGDAVRSGSAEITATVDGETRHYEFEASPILADPGRQSAPGDEDAERLGRLFVFRDVTLRKRQERRVQRKNARLEEFASVVSHDLRNPLNVAQGRVELALEAREGDDENLAAAAGALDRMERLIAELLTLAREGKTVEEPEPVDLDELVESCWANVVTEGATLVVTSEQTIRADRSRMRSLLENLLRNAVEHGGPDVTITVGDLADRRGFYVADDGVGIPVAERERVFESGYSTAPNGNGLGLAIVRVVAEAHGWSVAVTESEAGGARVEFTGVDTGA
jgi:signal transduction histidine kinase